MDFAVIVCNDRRDWKSPDVNLTKAKYDYVFMNMVRVTCQCNDELLFSVHIRAVARINNDILSMTLLLKLSAKQRETQNK